MQNNQHGLLINNRIYPVDSLQELCDNIKKNSDIPDWEKKVYAFIGEWINDEEYIEQSSSGTSGTPKTLKLSKKSMTISAEITCKLFDLQFGYSALLCLPIDYIAGKMMVVRAFVGGLNLLLTEPSSMPDLANFGNIEFCSMVPLQAYNSLNSIETLRRIKKLIIGGAEIRNELEVMLHDLPIEVYATYGMAETCSHVAIRRISGTEQERLYRAVPGVNFSVDDRACLVIEADFFEKNIVTNDVVDLTDSTSFRWIGRFDNLINSGGLKIVPEEIETVISKTTGLDCAVIGIEDKKLGEKVVLVLEKGGSEITEKELESALIDELPKRYHPKEIIFVDELPRNHSFKVDRFKLKEQLKNR